MDSNAEAAPSVAQAFDGFSDRERLYYDPLRQSPQEFAQSEDNPFACPPPAARSSYCDWANDPLVARSPREAAWMARRGYPTLQQRTRAASLSLVELESEAELLNSDALRALALQRRVAEARDSETAQQATFGMFQLAARSGSFYALEQAALAQIPVLELTVAESGWTPTDPAQSRKLSSAASRARNTAIKLVLLGDAGAASRIGRALESVPGLREASIGNSSLTLAAIGTTARRDYFELSRQARREAAGVVAYPAFSLNDVDVRPMVEQFDVEGRSEGVWVDE
jgi:hypothetical protein